MQQYYENDERRDFARVAAKYFEEHPEAITYTAKGEPEPGELVAFRWGLDGDCVVVFRVDYEEPINYCQFIDKEKAKLYRKFCDAGLAAIKF